MIVEILPLRSSVDYVMKELNNDLKKTDSVLKKAVNATAKEARTKLVKQTRKAYTLKRSKFKEKNVAIKKATKNKAGAILHVEGEQIPVKTGYQSRQNSGKSAAKAKIIMGGSLKGLIKKGESSSGTDLKAFTATMPTNGHKGIFMRATPEEQANSKNSKNPSRLIKQIHSLSSPSAAGNEKRVWGVIGPDVYGELSKQVYKFMNEMLGRGAA